MYRLVIQLPIAQAMPFPDEFDVMEALESQFMELEGNGFEVDGHDIGSGVMNIFILTSNPRAAFGTVEPFLPHDRAWRAGFRSADADVYTPLAPPGLANFEIKGGFDGRTHA